MVAEPGRRYAQVIGGRVHWTFTIVELPEWNENAFLTVDITDQPNVVEGFIHRGGMSFQPPPPPPGPRAETIALRNHLDALQLNPTADPDLKALAAKLRPVF